MVRLLINNMERKDKECTQLHFLSSFACDKGKKHEFESKEIILSFTATVFNTVTIGGIIIDNIAVLNQGFFKNVCCLGTALYATLF